VRGRDEPVSLREHVYGELRWRLMMGRFDIQGRLVEERLAVELDVSRTPVREALIRLASDGLLARREGGYYPVLPDLSQLRDLYELRITLELRGLARAIESPTVKHDRDQLEELRETWCSMLEDVPGPDPEFVLLDEQFHTELSRASGNLALTEALDAVNARIRPVRMYDFLTEDRMELTIVEHVQVVELVLAGRSNEALAALHSHVGESMDVVEQRVVRALTQMTLHRGQA
jgi:DNA-binding GntR family transcriptional regulator